MSLVSLTGVAIAYGASPIVDAIDLRLERGDRLAIVGRNGAGKTSLLSIISGALETASGTVEYQRDVRIAHLPQEVPPPQADTVLDEVIASRADLLAMRLQLTVLEQHMAIPQPDMDSTLEEYGTLQHRYEDQGGYDLEARAREALGGLGVEPADWVRSPAELSGGQQRRVELAKLLLQDADLLLIDEPTNHLDLAAIEWLEDFMRDVTTAFVLVSHDRRFLDRVCTAVLEIEARQAELYPGNYSKYTRLRTERRLRRAREYNTQQEQIGQLQDFIRRYRAGSRAREARGRQHQLDHLVRLPPPPRQRLPQLRFAPEPGSAVLLRTTDLEVGRDSTLLALRGQTIEPGDRIAITGANGTGKSTLLHTLAGRLAPRSGRITMGPRTERRLYLQDQDRNNAEVNARTVLEELQMGSPTSDEHARSLLGTLMFRKDEVDKLVSDLSGGERARLLLGKLALEHTNLLLLDEPTNHLDIAMQEVLEAALLRYPGAIILVTHDRALIDAVATRTWAVEDGGIREVLGGYADLVRGRAQEHAAAVRAAEAEAGQPVRGRRPSPTAAAAGPGIRRLEAEIAAAEAELADVRRRLLEHATFANPAIAADTGREHDRLEGALADLYERWAAAADG